MGWPSDFTRLLQARTVEPKFLLESVGVPTGTPAFGGELKLSSVGIVGYTAVIRRQGTKVSTGRLKMVDWRCTTGTFTVGIAGEDQLDFRQFTTRGQIVKLRLGFTNEPADFETIALGVVWDFVRDGSGWQILCRDILGMLPSRLTDVVGESELNFDLASTTVTPVQYVSGAADIRVASTTGFRDDGSGVGVIKVTPAGGTAFFLTYDPSLTTATRFFGLSGTGQFETTAVNSPSGSVVEEVAYTSEHPLIVARRLIIATGTGTNGFHDVLPKSWGYGLPVHMFNVSDSKHFIDATQPDTGSDKWELVSDAVLKNGKTFIDGWLQTGGFFLTMAQGEMTARAALDMSVAGPTPGHLTIDHSNIHSIDAYHTWDPEQAIEYAAIRVEDQGGNVLELTNPLIETLPAADKRLYVLAGVYSGNANRIELRREVGFRTAPMVRRIAARLDLTISGFHAAQAGPGDSCDLTLDTFLDRVGNPFEDRRCMVLSATADYFNARTRLSLAIPRIGSD